MMKNTPTDIQRIYVRKSEEDNLKEIIKNSKSNIIEIYLVNIEFENFVEKLRNILENNIYKTVFVYERRELFEKNNRNIKKNYK